MASLRQEKDMTYIRDAVDKMHSLAPDMKSSRGKENQNFEADLCPSAPWARFLDSEPGKEVRTAANTQQLLN